jgi:citrate synthase
MSETEEWKEYWTTDICELKGVDIFIRGYSLPEIIGKYSYGSVLFLALKGRLPNKLEGEMMEALLCAIIDHAFIAAAVPAARFVVSGNPNLTAGLAAGILAMGSQATSPEEAGRLIYRADEMVKKENLSIKKVADLIVSEYRKNRKRIPGLGLPVGTEYDVRDKRLREIAEQKGLIGQKTLIYEAVRERLSESIKRDMPINVDGRMACVLCEMDFDPLEMGGMAALSYLPGILAHVIEEMKGGKPLRILPDLITKYTGVPPRSLDS